MRQALIAVMVLLLVPAGASAATASVDVHVSTGKGCSVSPESCVQAELDFTAAAGEANDVEVSTAGSSLVVRDPGTGVSAGSGCQQQGPKMVRCSPPEGPSMGFVLISVVLGDGVDVLRNTTGIVSSATGGSGDDRLTGGTSSDTFDGGAGRDRLEGADGSDYLQDTGPVEPDVLDGGAGYDKVDYSMRAARVTVDLRGPASPSGAAGEDDSLVGIEEGHGGRGPDLLRAGADPVVLVGHGGADRIIGGFGNDLLIGNTGDDKLYGIGGSDRLVGGAGNDGLRAGCGRSKLFGNAGNDRFDSRNGAANRVVGGAGRDVAVLDQLDTTQQVERRTRQHIDACAL
ncbi:MAG TPA: calcium-binding protein [Thermoleophilaceae bacterium]|jgi:Ca2+-binding RTX toxin-like protein